MVELRVVGRLDLRDQRGAELRSVLTQPKRVALLTYLVLAQPRDFHRRDKLLALFWPELDESHARNALNQALSFLRRALGEEVLIGRGADEVGIDPDRLSCDAVTFETRIDGGQLDEALALYRGDLLEGFHADASTEFDSWLESERTRLRALARSGAGRLCADAEAAGELSAAAGWSRRALMIDPLDEQSLRRLVLLLDRSGDRAAAVRAYKEFASRLNRELELEPAPETRAVIESVRQRAETLLHAFEEPASHSQPRPGSIRETISEVHRRSIWQILGVYLGASWLGYQVVIELTDGIGLPDWVPGFALVLFVIGLPVVVVTAFVQHGPPILRKLTVDPEREESTQQHVISFRSARHFLTWRRSVLGGVAAFVLLAAATLGFMTMRNAAVGPFSTLAAEGRLSARDRIVLVDFGSPTGDTTLGRVVTEALRIDLLQSSFVRLAEPALIREALQRMQRDPRAGISQDAARDLAVREGYKAVVIGDVSQVGNGYVLTGQLQAAVDGAVLLALREVARDSTQLIDAIERFSKTLRERSGESLKSLSASEPLWAVSTASLTALRKYSEAMRVQNETGDERRVVALLEEAIELDSTFSMAIRKASQSYSGIGGDRGKVVELARRAYDLSHRLPEKERYLAIATYHDRVRGDRARTIAAYRSILALDPDDYYALNNLPIQLNGDGDYAGSEELLRRGAGLPGASALHYSNLIDVQFILGHSAGADSTLERALHKFPGNEVVESQRMRLPQRRRQWTLAETAAQEHLRKFERNRGGRLRALTLLGNNAVIRGQLRTARRYHVELERAAAEEDNLLTRLNARIQASWTTLTILGDSTKAIAQLDSAWRELALDRIPALSRPNFEMVSLLVNAGAADRCQRFLDEYEQTLAPDERGRGAADYLRLYRAQIGFAQRPSLATIAEFQRAVLPWCLSCSAYEIAAGFDRLALPDSAIAHYERFSNATQVSADRDARWLHATYLRLGQLYDARGDSGRAADYYNRFVTLWKDADPELQPRVAAVQRRLAELQRKPS